jgi:hypothetical protein
MKAYIGPYKNWIGPHDIADKIPFASKETKEKIGDWLADTWVSVFCLWLDSKRHRKIKVHIDKYDTWSMDHTLAYIILPMLKQLRDTKHGSAMVDDEDVPPHMRHSDCRDHDGNLSEWGSDNWVHYKWEWVLNEMIFAFESKLDDSWQDKFHHGESMYEWEFISGEEDDDDDMYKMNQVNPDYSFDIDGYKEYSDRITNGFRLFGKYYQGLWD